MSMSKLIVAPPQRSSFNGFLRAQPDCELRCRNWCLEEGTGPNRVHPAPRWNSGRPPESLGRPNRGWRNGSLRFRACRLMDMAAR